MTKSMKRILAALMALACAAALAAQELTDAEWAALKAAALAKPRVIVNHDGCDATAWPASSCTSK